MGSRFAARTSGRQRSPEAFENHQEDDMRDKSISTWMLALLLLQVIPPAANAANLRVPLQYPTIQAAIDAAVTGDIVHVSPGFYAENINFNGKAISVIAVRGPRPAVIDGRSKASVVTFNSREGAESVLSGFVIQHGFGGSTNNIACLYDGGGICIAGASPTIEYNTIQDNSACTGAGIYINGGSALVSGNLIQNNTQGGCSGGSGGGGILLSGAARIINNIIQNNSMVSAYGGGISMNSAGTPLISGNIIRGNSASGITPCTGGGGIAMVNQSDATIVQNQITGNSATCGAGVYWLVPLFSRGPYLVNNTIAHNTGTAAVNPDGFDWRALLINNIIVGGPGQNAVYCGGFSNNPPLIQFNDIYSANVSAYGGACTDQTGIQGNISADPLFVSAIKQNYRLEKNSPAIGAGSISAPNLPAVAFDGNARVQHGKVDMGIHELALDSAAIEADDSAIDRFDQRTPHVANSPDQSAGRFYSNGPDDRRTFYAYDASGKLIFQTDANGNNHVVK